MRLNTEKDSHTTRKKIIAIILTIVIWGLGHVYLRRVKRGIILFFIGLAIALGSSFLIPFPFPIFVILAYVGLLGGAITLLAGVDPATKAAIIQAGLTYCP